MFRQFFDQFMRKYAKIFLLLIVLAFVANEFTSKKFMVDIIRGWAGFHIFLLVAAFILQYRFFRLIQGDHKRMAFVSMVVNKDKMFDNVKFITHVPSHIPSEFHCKDPNANLVLNALRKHPYIIDLAWTFHDRKYIRFSWLAVRKEAPDVFMHKLKFGDVILYHKDKSLVGFLIRLFTRCYWEHTAVYIGGGRLTEASPGGVKKINIEPWLVDDRVKLGILRPNGKIENKDEVMSKIEGMLGQGYAYHKVIQMWWRIVTGSTKLGFMTPIILFLNLSLVCWLFYISFKFQDLTRLQIAILMIISPYMFDSIHHKLAYSKSFDYLEELDNEEP